jgi:hypothetical protein
MKALPINLLKFLDTNSKLNYDPTKAEVGEIEFYKTPPLIDLYLESQDNQAKGYYIIQAYDLLEKVEGYEPAGILVWIPSLGCFGSWDNDHWKLVIFQGKGWQDIERDPLKYLNSQWSKDLGDGEYLSDTSKLEFKEGSPC